MYSAATLELSAPIKAIPRGQKKPVGLGFFDILPGDIFFVRGRPFIADKKPTFRSDAGSETPFVLIDEHGNQWVREDLDAMQN